jgi:hypothetical protein
VLEATSDAASILPTPSSLLIKQSVINEGCQQQQKNISMNTYCGVTNHRQYGLDDKGINVLFFKLMVD